MKFSNKQLSSTLQEYIKKAEAMIQGNQGQQRLNKMLLSIKNNARIDKAFAAVSDQFKLAISLVKDYYNGVYRKVSYRSIIKILAALIYIVNPFDIVPDFLLGIGFLDDVAVFTFIMNQIESELEKYRQFKANAASSNNEPIGD